MLKNIFFYIKLLLFVLLFIDNSNAVELSIIPLKKPILDNKTKQSKLEQEIIRPKSKPIKKVKKQKSTDEIIKTDSKKSNETKDVVTKVTKKKFKQIEFLLPKSKPLIVKKSSTVVKKGLKFFSKRDFEIAKKAIEAIEKRQWAVALSLSKKAKDKSIYNFIQWRHLLTTGNQASFYDYLTFIKRNEDYPRISRIRYLAEHKLSTDNISPKKIIDWFDSKEPLSGYGKLILGESFVKTGDIKKGTSLIKNG
jgi:soluble lytic murein transglycosylase